MTAEIAVMNQSAVALAADSAATRSEAKIFTANKIFALSKYRPVAVMIYGSSACMNVPWETIIKQFRAELGEADLATVSDFGDALFKYIGANRALFPQSEQEQFAFIYAAEKFARIKKNIVEAVNTAIAENGPITQEQASDLAQGVLDQRKTFWKGRPRRKNVPRDARRRAREQYGNQIVDARDQVLQQLPLTAKQRETLMQITLDSWYKQPQSGQSGIVVAGFGRDDMFPALVNYEIDGVLLNRPISWTSGDVALSQNNRAVVVPFAQDDMIRLFVEGVTPAYEAFVESYFEQLVNGLNAMVVSELPADQAMQQIKDDLEKNRATVIGSLSEKLREERKALYVDPLLSILSGLPLNELASLAESLVNLTSLRRRVSLDKEDVGGPIDVAVISRGDGLVWIKRKHYFPAELNQQFFANYFRTKVGHG